ncbi:MAG: APC family permease, partial [Pseudomonadota bacterium]|nr:APC family permease [Pseudomonadota bacterium]
RRPSVTLPRAILITIGSTALLYFLVQLAFVAAFPGGGPDTDAPLIDLGALIAGPAGAGVLTLAAIFSLAGNLHGNMTATPRVTHAMGARGDLPRWFAGVNARFATPGNSILFMAAVAAALALTGSFVWLAAVSVLARLIVYAATIAALPKAPERPRITAAHGISGAIGIGLCAYAALQADAEAWLTLAVLAVAGLLLYALAARGSRSSSSTARVSAIQPPPSTRDPS